MLLAYDQGHVVKDSSINFSLPRQPLQGVAVALNLKPCQGSIHDSDVGPHRSLAKAKLVEDQGVLIIAMLGSQKFMEGQADISIPHRPSMTLSAARRKPAISGTRARNGAQVRRRLERARKEESPAVQPLQAMELGGFEPPTSWVRSRRSAS
jgi:hypothetical protein